MVVSLLGNLSSTVHLGAPLTPWETHLARLAEFLPRRFLRSVGRNCFGPWRFLPDPHRIDPRHGSRHFYFSAFRRRIRHHSGLARNRARLGGGGPGLSHGPILHDPYAHGEPTVRRVGPAGVFLRDHVRRHGRLRFPQVHSPTRPAQSAVHARGHPLHAPADSGRPSRRTKYPGPSPPGNRRHHHSSRCRSRHGLERTAFLRQPARRKTVAHAFRLARPATLHHDRHWRRRQTHLLFRSGIHRGDGDRMVPAQHHAAGDRPHQPARASLAGIRNRPLRFAPRNRRHVADPQHRHRFQSLPVVVLAPLRTLGREQRTRLYLQRPRPSFAATFIDTLSPGSCAGQTRRTIQITKHIITSVPIIPYPNIAPPKSPFDFNSGKVMVRYIAPLVPTGTTVGNSA